MVQSLGVTVETRAFTARIGDLLNDEEYRAVQLQLVGRPTAGDIIPGTGGLRKVRWGMQRAGKTRRLQGDLFLASRLEAALDALRVLEEREGRPGDREEDATADY